MEFRILGPLEVLNDRGAVRLGGTKPRAVLAVLALHANEAVSAERLALALWGEDAPSSAIKTVQVHVSRLRRALGDADIITTTPAGYRLRVRPDELDAARFERLVQDGRRALASGEPERAAAVLDFELMLVNARHVKQVPGRKTDMSDAAWLCQLAEAGLLKANFVPPKPIRDLRQLTRYRKTQIAERQREAQRLHKGSGGRGHRSPRLPQIPA